MRIVETEAYSSSEKGCHAYKNKKTKRNEAMFMEGGNIYVFQIYGIHFMFNIVSGHQNQAEAVLIRGLEPILSYDTQTNQIIKSISWNRTNGPGKLCKTMQIDKSFNKQDIYGD